LSVTSDSNGVGVLPTLAKWDHIFQGGGGRRDTGRGLLPLRQYFLKGRAKTGAEQDKTKTKGMGRGKEAFQGKVHT